MASNFCARVRGRGPATVKKKEKKNKSSFKGNCIGTRVYGNQCCGSESGSGRIRTFLSDPDPDPEISAPNPDPAPALVVCKKISVSVQYHVYVYLFTP